MSQLWMPLCDPLGISLPIIQTPMAGGPSAPELLAAVRRAGAFGSFGFSYTQPEAMQRAADAVRAHTQAPFGVSLFVSPQPEPVALEAVTPYSVGLGLPAPEPVRPPYAPDLQAQLALIESMRPPVFTFHLGDLSMERIWRMRSLGIAVGGSATCVAEAQRAAELGVDFIAAQGAEAGRTACPRLASQRARGAATRRGARSARPARGLSPIDFSGPHERASL
jgi:nitronate monooxygenase